MGLRGPRVCGRIFLTKVVRMRICLKHVARMRTVQHCFRYVRVKAGVSGNSRVDKKKNPREKSQSAIWRSREALLNPGGQIVTSRQHGCSHHQQ